MEKMHWTLIKRLLVIVLLSAAILAAATDNLDKGLNHLGLERLGAANSAYLQKAQQRNLSLFLVLSAIKSSLAMLEGSSIGIGFNLQVGDLVQSVYDYVDIAWKAVLAGGIAVVILGFLLQVLSLLDNWALALLLAATTVLAAARWWLPYHDWLAKTARTATAFCTLLCIGFYLAIPLTITTAMAVSDMITRPVIQSAYQELDQLKNDLGSKEQTRPEKTEPENRVQDAPGILDFKARFNSLKQKLSATVELLELKARSMASLTFRLTAGFIFDCIIFPLALFFCLWPLAKITFHLASRSLEQ